jgi:hypothetical protein
MFDAYNEYMFGGIDVFYDDVDRDEVDLDPPLDDDVDVGAVETTDSDFSP